MVFLQSNAFQDACVIMGVPWAQSMDTRRAVGGGVAVAVEPAPLPPSPPPPLPPAQGGVFTDKATLKAAVDDLPTAEAPRGAIAGSSRRASTTCRFRAREQRDFNAQIGGWDAHAG